MRLNSLSLGVVALLLGLSMVAFTFRQQTPPGTGADGMGGMGWMQGGYGGMGWMHGGYGDQLPPALDFLRGIPPDQRFDHFRGGSATVTDQQGTARVLTLTPGTVQSVTANGVAVVPNGETTARTFNITADTRVLALPAPGSLQALVAGDKVVVLTLDNGADAIVIHKFAMRAARPMMPTPSP